MCRCVQHPGGQDGVRVTFGKLLCGPDFSQHCPESLDYGLCSGGGQC